MTWTVRRTRWGLSLYYRGELVASSDRPAALIALACSLTTDPEQETP